MKPKLIAIVAAVLLVGCGESQQSAPSPEANPVEPIAEVAQPEPPPEPSTAKAPNISIFDAAYDGNIEAVKQHLAAGTDVNAKDSDRWTPLYKAVNQRHKAIAELLIAKGANVNAKGPFGGTLLHEVAGRDPKEIPELLIAAGADVNAGMGGFTPLDFAILEKQTETADLLRKHGGKTGEDLKAEGR